MNFIDEASEIMFEDKSKTELETHFCRKKYVDLLKFMTGYTWKEGPVSKSDEIILNKKSQDCFGQKTIFDNNFDKVVLLSGGQDSLGGVAHLIDNGILNNTIFVTFQTMQKDTGNAESLISKLKLHYPNLLIKHLEYETKKEIKYKKKNHNQRTRSFWFLACAKHVAKYFNINEIWLFENGPVSLNIQATSDRKLTRTTHFKTIEMISKLFDINIVAPFEFMTKSEVISLCLKNEITKQFIESSNTCSKGKGANLNLWKGFTNKSSNCGICYSCIVRRISELNNGINSKKYKIFGNEKLIYEKSHRNILDDMKSNQCYFDEIIKIWKEERMAFFVPEERVEMMNKFAREISDKKWW